ncbi:RXT2 [Candida oxycetoniae]|uniref:RXT2 n=1 Tax=Candida oxycetoniae TaxID=497107 RepID=A0AAI9STP3_9ASCO|nr:RXT2 [Candida oxycetoniae]KAI3402613.2 RXT2 [Candida oxycetoniae]
MMLDSKSLEVISQFKAALTEKNRRSKDTLSKGNESFPPYNRGLKLFTQMPSLDSLVTKTVEYDGKTYAVLTNDLIERNNARSIRKWNGSNSGKKVFDDDGDDDAWSDADESEEQLHPLKQSHIIQILSPLNHPSELVTHPAISKTYTSQTLSKLAMELIDLIETEQNNLNWLNKLLQVLNGEDWFYLLEENLGLKDYDHGLDEEKQKLLTSKSKNNDTTSSSKESKESKDNGRNYEEVEDRDMDMDVNRDGVEDNEDDDDDEDEDDEDDIMDPFFALPAALKRYESLQEQLHAKEDNGVKEELINYLQVSIQRQHEYIENLTQLRNGLVRADRLKNDLHKWGKEMHDRRSS